MIVDTSALTAIFFQEPSRFLFIHAIERASLCRLNVANYLELTMVPSRLGTMEAIYEADRRLEEAGVRLEPVTQDQVRVARQGFFDFGKGRHPAGLNYGDCFAYALSKSLGEPLLYQGDDFPQTDIEPAAEPFVPWDEKTRTPIVIERGDAPPTRPGRDDAAD